MENSKKKIGIVGWNTGDNSFGVTKAYLHFISHFGIPIILTPDEEIRTDLDLLILPGGKDIDPSKYGHSPSFYNSDSNQMLDYFDNVKLPKYIDAGIPVFGICRGFQAINIFFGGTLTQHWVHAYSKERNELVHDLTIIDDLIRVHTLKGHIAKKLKTNSMHHQCVFDKDLGNDLIPTLLSEDGVIEGFRHTKLPIIGVQFHGEELFDEYSTNAILHLLNHKKSNPTLLEVIKDAA